MIEEKILSMENTILLLKHISYYSNLKRIWIEGFEGTSLCKRFEEMIIEEDEKKEEKNEKLLADLCECYISLSDDYQPKLLCICVSCILKATLKKEGNEEAQKEVEMALLSLSNLDVLCFVEQKQHLNEIKEIFKYHQEHHNLTRLAYQSAWEFLIYRLFFENSLEEDFVNELHFGREAARELDELSKCVEWKNKKEGKGSKETKEELVLLRWLQTCESCFLRCNLWNEEFVGLINSIVQVFRSAKGNYKEISYQTIFLLKETSIRTGVEIKDLMKSGVADAVLEGIQQQTLEDEMINQFLEFFMNLSKKLKREMDEAMDEAKRKIIRRRVFDKLEEEGYEDTITSLYEVLNFLKRKRYRKLSLDIYDYLVND
eukprot:MONOS_2141.1-p1 / transcript=MONOS_2141.1 / gene=MONOS_2141 / organism=Monocercomonoides_exilis_PA203 / gene_product=unspecified product / transcript_product=unspecified product / location=Mono_scaffold00042:82397-83577(+) / protein_length=373 / sequence_SO=supercontig / SO=protein_coding / is_pseudo=false